MDERQKILLEKVRKLLALSESPNEHEAALAAAKAQEILDRENLSIFDLKPPSVSDVDSYTISEQTRHAAWKSHLFTKLARIYDLRPYHQIGTLKVVGFKQDVDVFQYIHTYLSLVIELLALKEKRRCLGQDRKQAFRFRTSFCHGASDRICEIIKLQRAERLSQDVKCTALVIQKKSHVNSWANQHLNLRNKSVSRNSFDNDAYNKGIIAAGNINLRDAIAA